MKKYKHKTIPELIARLNDSTKKYEFKIMGENVSLARQLIETSNDWEEIKEEPNYLITAFISKDGVDEYILQSNGKYKHESGNEYHFDTLCTISSYVIKSCKNSKGEELTIGDYAFFKTTLEWQHATSKILKFELLDNFILATTEDRQGNIEYLFNDKDKKTPIYTTTDGVEVFEGDRLTLYPLGKDLTIGTLRSFVVVVKAFSEQDKEVADRYLTFTSEENRDKYIKEHTRKPVFISADNVEFFEQHLGGDYSLFSVLPKANWQENRYRLNDCIKFPKKEWLHFHTKEARQEYIYNNKPKYSLKDIENVMDKFEMFHKSDYTFVMNAIKALGK